MRFLLSILMILAAGLASAQVKDVAQGVYTPGFRSVPNYIKNPSCFANVNDISTAATGAVSRTTSSPLEGNASCSVSATTAGGTISFALKTLDNALSGRTCEAMFNYNGNGANFKVYAYNTTDAVKASQELTLVDAGTGAKEGYILFPCGDLTDTYVLRFEALSTPSAAIKVSNIQYGTATRLGQGSPVTGWQTFTPTGSWTTNTTYTGRYRQVGQNLEVHATATTSGAPTAASFTVNLPSGFTIDTSKLSGSPSANATGVLGVGVATDAGSNSYPVFALYNSTTSIILGAYNAASATSASRVTVSNTAPFTFGSTDTIDIQFTVPVLELSGSVSTIVAPDQSNYDWTSYTPTFTGFGTVTSPECFHKREGSDLLVRCKGTTGTTTATEARVSLPGSLVAAGTDKIPSIAKVGDLSRGVSAASQFSFHVLQEPSVAYVTFGVQGSAAAGMTKVTGSGMLGTSETFSFLARIPIAGWVNPGVIVGSLQNNSVYPGVKTPKTCIIAWGGASATLASPTECTTGTCVEVYDSCGTASPPTWTATGTYDNITWAAGTWANSTFIDCFSWGYDLTSGNGRAGNNYFVTGDNTWTTTSSGGYVGNTITTTPAGAAGDAYAYMSCTGESP